MKQLCPVLLTETAFRCLSDIESFYINIGQSPLEVAEFIDSMINDSVGKIRDNVNNYKYNILLADFGILLKEYINTQYKYRILYKIENDIIYIVLILHNRQDLEKALFRHLIQL